MQDRRLGVVDLDTVTRVFAGNDRSLVPVADRRLMRARAQGVNFEVLYDGRPYSEDRIVKAASSLVARGATVVVGNCGFMAKDQAGVASRIGVPFLSSSMLLIPLVLESVGANGAVGVVTAKGDALTPELFAAAGVTDTSRVRVAGLDTMPHFADVILGLQTLVNVDVICAELEEIIDKMLADSPEIRSIVFECTLLPPYSQRMRERFGLPIYDVASLRALVLHALGL